MSPAGDWEAMRAAVANGASAVYFGLDQFNARHRAANFSLEELPEIVAYLHGHNVKGYLTFNTLIFSDELGSASDYIQKIASAGIDAVIVQDLGLVRLIRTLAPTLPIHGSTQMTLTEPRGIEFVANLGVSRVVLARELSLPEIRQIAERTDTELEAFVHGALCVAYSGQCLTSESIGGRSANRGQCAQACRLPYELVVDGEIKDLGDKAYLLSPQDLAAYDIVDELADAGIACLKIEGRLKSAHYVAATTQTYRKALDQYAGRRRFAISPQERADLEQTFSRGFTHGFLSGVNHQKLIAARSPKSRGVRVGVVSRVSDHSITLSLESTHTLKPGDGVVFDEGHPDQDEQGGRVFHVDLRGKRAIEIELGHGDINFAAVRPGAIVWRTDDPALRKRLEHSFSRDAVVHRIPLDASIRAHVGEKLAISLQADGESASVEWEKPLETARKFPLNEDLVREQLSRLGDTPFELRHVQMDVAGSPMVPKSVLNDLRRQAVGQILQALRVREKHAVVTFDALDALRRQIPTTSNAETNHSLYVLTRTLDQLQAVLDQSVARPAMVYCDFEDIRRYRQAVELSRNAGVPIALATLRIVKSHEDGLLNQILDCAPDAILVRNLGAISYYREQAPGLPQIGDYSLNVANELTAKLFLDSGLIRMVPSYDLSWQQLGAMLRRSDASWFECVIHQHMPMFHMEHCVFAHTLSNGKDYRDCGRPCETHQVDLRDRVGQPHPLIPDVGCRNTVFNAQAQSAAEYVPRMRDLGVRHFRVELLRETAAEVTPLLERYSQIITGRLEPRAAMRSLRVLNQLGVTSGTLERE